jgi:cytochrome c biogenesis protein CcmG/thiol:disulfide interchange protein DsbE
MTVILAHELAHVSRHDFEINVALEVLAVIAFYHPISHWIKKQITESREMICDEMAAGVTAGPAAYAKTLLALAEPTLKKSGSVTFSLGMFETTRLERRIMNLVDARPPLAAMRRRFLTTCCWIAISASSAGAVLFSLHPSTVHAAGAPAFFYDATQTFDVITPKISRKPAADFTLTDNKGKTITLSDYKGKVVLLDFWATWCGGCKLEIPWYMEFYKKYKDQGLAVIGVSMDDEGWKVVRPFLAKKRDAETGGIIAMEYPIVIGNDSLGHSFDLTSMPMTLLIDRDGKIAVSHTGVVDKDNFEANIRELLK